MYVLLILGVSSIPRLRAPGFEGSDKIAHLGEYAVLGLLVRRAAGRSWRGWIAAAIVVAIVGMLDELYQSTVPGRTSSPFDWMADVIGGCAGATVWSVLIRKRAGGASGPRPMKGMS